MESKKSRIPGIPCWLLKRTYILDIEEGYIGDIEEEFHEILNNKGRRRAFVWIWVHAAMAILKTLKRSFLRGGDLFKNDLKIAARNTKKHKGFSFINITGLAVGMTVCLLLLQYVTYERSYDDFHENGDNIVRLRLTNFAGSHGAAGRAVKESFPEVLDYVKLNRSNAGGLYSFGEKIFQDEKAFFASSSFFRVFSFKLLKGDPDTALSEINTAVLTESAAKRYFGTTDPIGKSFRFQGKIPFEVTGVVEDVPDNSHFHFDLLLSHKTLIKIKGEWIESTWISCPFYTYLCLRPDTDVEIFTMKLSEFFEKKEAEIPKNERDELEYHLQPLKSIHLFSRLDFEIENNGNGRLVYFLTAVALLILAIAWINYINLSVVKSMERAREIGIRKVVGAFRVQLIQQFLSESLLFNFISAALAIVIALLTIPHFNRLAGIPPSFMLWSDLEFWLVLVSMFFAGSFLSGLYPAFILSSYKPSAVLKGRSFRSGKGRLLRKCLVVFQFGISFALIAGTFTVYKQISFMKSQDLGIDIDQTLVVRGPQYSVSDDRLFSPLDAFKTEVKRIPAVSHAAVSTFVPGEDAWVRHSARRKNVPKGDEKEFRIIGVDNDYIDFYELDIMAGRNFYKNIGADQNSLIINEAALEQLDFKSPDDAVDQDIIYRDKPHRIVGVIKNYHQESLKKNYEPQFLYRFLWNAKFSLKVNTWNLQETILSIQKTWNRIFPSYPFEYFFLDEHFDRQYRADVQFGKISGLFTFLAIFIGCLGLFALSLYETVLRTKEIGIRKILGASTRSVLTMLLKDSIFLIFLSSIIASPVSYFYFHNWLGNYAFRIEIGWWFFSIPVIFILFIALSSVSYSTLKASLANPVENLRYE
jgi:putative ABC transport system permease protein